MTDQPFTEEDRARVKKLRDSYLSTAGDNYMVARNDANNYASLDAALAHALDAALAHIDRLEGALRDAADDLGKAANQFEGLRLAGKPPEHNEAIFAAKEARARAALDPAPTEQEDTDEPA